MASRQSSSNFLSRPVSNAYNLDKIHPVKQYRRVAASELRPIVAIDTETYRGDIVVLADSDGNYLDHPNITMENVIPFFFRHQYKWIFCYNLSFDGDIISKLLGSALNDYLRTGKLSFTYTNSEGKQYKIRYIENKSLTISRSKHAVTIYDIAQFYDKTSLAKAYTENLKQALPSDYLAMKAKRAYFSFRYYRRRPNLVRHYCHLDCLYTKALAEHWVKIFYESYNFYPARWLSAGYLAEKVLKANNVNIPYFDQIPYDVQKLALAAFYGGRFEMLYKGLVGKGYDYDINSAYPYALTTIPDPTEGQWIVSKQVHPDAKLGFFHIVAQVHSSNRIAPFPFRQKSGRIFFPFGQFETDVTLPELRAVDDWIKSSDGSNRVKYKILQGYQFLPNRSPEDCKYIFKDFIVEQYRRRQRLKQKGSPLQRTIKVILNSIYGKTAQKTKVGRGKVVMGNLFCPVIASHITGFTRAQLFSTTHQHNLEDDLVAYATDSITTRRPLANFAGDRLGQMKLANQGNDFFMIQNGMVRSNGVWKLRGVGFDRAKNIPIEHIETRETSDGRVVITLKRLRPQRLKSAILTGRIGDVGKFLTYTKEINLNADSKRFWLGKLTSIHTEDCFNSVPLDINLGGKIFASESAIEFYSELEDYNPYDIES